jgi:hypothetical protein
MRLLLPKNGNPFSIMSGLLMNPSLQSLNGPDESPASIPNGYNRAADVTLSSDLLPETVITNIIIIIMLKSDG